MTAGVEMFFDPPVVSLLPVQGQSAQYPVHRIFCVGRNYEAHALEMGMAVDRETPFYFMKPSSATVQSGAKVKYPPGTDNYHYEMELVVAIGAPAFRVSVDEAAKAIFGYATGLDMTRRDLQLEARKKGRPWELGKSFEESAVIAEIVPAADVPQIGPQKISLLVGDEVKQEAHLSDLVWSVEELISHLSRFYHLEPGDLIFTGTPAGVGPVLPGDVITGHIDGLPSVTLEITPAD